MAKHSAPPLIGPTRLSPKHRLARFAFHHAAMGDHADVERCTEDLRAPQLCCDVEDHGFERIVPPPFRASSISRRVARDEEEPA